MNPGSTLHTSTHHACLHLLIWSHVLFCGTKKAKLQLHTHLTDSIAKNMGWDWDVEWHSKIVWHSKNIQDNDCALSIASALLIHSSHGVRVIHLGFEVDLQHLKPNGMHQAFRSGNLRLSHLRGSNKHHVRNVVSMSRQQNYTEIPWHPKPFELVWKPYHSLPKGFD